MSYKDPAWRKLIDGPGFVIGAGVVVFLIGIAIAYVLRAQTPGI